MKAKALVAILLILICGYSFCVAASAAEITYPLESEKVVLAENQNEFTIDFSVNNDGDAYSGAQISFRLGDVELVSVDYAVKDFDSAGPVTRNDITTFGFYSTENAFADGKICSATFKYTGTENTTMEITETLISTRIDLNNVTGDRKNPMSVINVEREGNSVPIDLDEVPTSGLIDDIDNDCINPVYIILIVVIIALSGVVVWLLLQKKKKA